MERKNIFIDIPSDTQTDKKDPEMAENGIELKPVEEMSEEEINAEIKILEKRQTDPQELGSWTKAEFERLEKLRSMLKKNRPLSSEESKRLEEFWKILGNQTSPSMDPLTDKEKAEFLELSARKNIKG